ncbi:retropepsin-like aspartic protease family protein [Planktotalea arctica]|uniref:retropepsin-like aspartic protease family protein n=1 Tax=Planktotalea arctica TaxID=1481893 RepID=UPI000A16E42C|nr:TIGR02281 family clan AA aspartic protease [Planktotalea arctica]
MAQFSGDEFGNLIYLVILGGVLAFWFFTSARRSMNKMLQQMAAWALIFIGVIAAYGMWGDIRQTVSPQQSVFDSGARFELPRARDGHYYATAMVNDVAIRFVVDTGATDVVLRKADAEAAGIDLETLAFLGRAMTANGPVRIASVRTQSFGLPGAELARFRVDVNEGEMSQSLMGMSYLQTFERIEISGGTLVLTR